MVKLNPFIKIFILLNLFICGIIIFFGIPFVFCSSLINFNKLQITIGGLGVVILCTISVFSSYKKVGEEELKINELYTILLGVVGLIITIIAFWTKMI